MASEIEPINELPAAKRRKKWAEAHAHLECPAPFTLQILTFHPETKFLSIAFEGIRKVATATFENSRKNRQDHEWTRNQEHRKRYDRFVPRRKAEQKSLLNKVEKIHKS